MRNRKTIITAALACLTLHLAMASATPSNNLELMAAAPDAQELAILEELAAWVGDEGELITGDSLGETIRTRRDSFDLFRHFHAAQDLREQVLVMPFGSEIAQVSERFGVDGLLLASIVEAESNFDPEAVSPVGALGLMQVMPATAGVEEGGELLEPRFNLEVGSRYMARLLDEFQGDLELALAAYNAGPGAVRRFDGVPPYRETRRYVEKVLSIYVRHHRNRWRQSDATNLLAQL